MSVNDLIKLLEKVNTKTATVYVNNSERVDYIVHKVIVEHDMEDDDVSVVLKTD